MPKQWKPPSAKRHPIDFAALGIPAGHYPLPDMTNYYLIPNSSQEGARRISAFLDGTAGLDSLHPAEASFTREHFLNAAKEQRCKNIAHFETKVPKRYTTAHPDQKATTWAQAVVANPEETRSLLIVGPTGTGKTHYAYSALRAIAETGYATRWATYTAADLYAQLRPRTGRDSETEFDKITDFDVLFVDDLGAAKLTEWTEEVTYRLINHRYEQCKPGIFTSNVPPKQLRVALGERIASRLTEMCERITLKGDDRRKAMAA